MWDTFGPPSIRGEQLFVHSIHPLHERMSSLFSSQKRNKLAHQFIRTFGTVKFKDWQLKKKQSFCLLFHPSFRFVVVERVRGCQRETSPSNTQQQLHFTYLLILHQRRSPCATLFSTPSRDHGHALASKDASRAMSQLDTSPTNAPFASTTTAWCV